MKKKFLKFKPYLFLSLVFFVTLSVLAFLSIYSTKTSDLTLVIASAKQFSEECKTDSEWRRCYGDKLGVFNRTHKLSDTLKVLGELNKEDPKTRDCHLLAHKIASEEVAKDPKNWINLFKYVDQDMCIGGYIHGAMEGRKRFDSNFEINAKTIPELCDTINKFTGKTNIDPCAHVIGHILLAEVYGDLSEGATVCNELNGQLKTSCNNGMFMENITRDNLVEHSVANAIPFDEDSARQIEKTCNEFTATSRTSCWREISHLYAPLGKSDPIKMFELCSRASSENNRDECYFHSFNSIMAQNKFSDEQIKFLCSNYLDSPKLNFCLKWATYVMVTSSTRYTEKAINFCGRVGNGLEKKCFTELGKTLARLTDKKEQENLCASAPKEHKNSCSCSDCARASGQAQKLFED